MSDNAKRVGERSINAARNGNRDESRPPPAGTKKKKKACGTCARLTEVLEKFKEAMNPLAERARQGNESLVSETIAVLYFYRWTCHHAVCFTVVTTATQFLVSLLADPCHFGCLSCNTIDREF